MYNNCRGTMHRVQIKNHEKSIENNVGFGLDRTEKGITLIALVVTIIIMLILIGITLSLVNNDGMVSKADYATKITREKAAEEELEMAIMEVKMDKLWNCNLNDVLEEFKKAERTDIQIINVVSSNIAYVQAGYAIPEGTPTEITLIVTKYPEFTFTLGEAGRITKISGIAHDEWNGETVYTPEVATQITIEADPSSQTANYEENQEVEITVTCNKSWGEYEGSYAWSGSNENEPEEWTTLSLSDEVVKTVTVTNAVEYDGSYYLWVKIEAAGIVETQCFGPYNFQRTPTENDVLLDEISKDEDETVGWYNIVCDKIFDGWTLSYQINSVGEYTEISMETPTEVELVNNDMVNIKFSKTGKIDVIFSIPAPGLKTAYRLSYDFNGGIAGPENRTQYDNATFTIPNTVPTKDGYNFVNWKDLTTNTTYNPGAELTISNGTTMTLTAQWTIKTYSITYNKNSGSGTMSSQTKTHGVAINLSSNGFTAPSGKKFKEWNTNSSGTGTSYAAGESYTNNEALTLYAIWEPKTYTITYNANDGTSSPATTTGTKTHGVTYSIASNTFTAPSGKQFKEWNTNSSGTGTKYAVNANYTTNANLTLYAIWEDNFNIDTTVSGLVDYWPLYDSLENKISTGVGNLVIYKGGTSINYSRNNGVYLNNTVLKTINNYTLSNNFTILFTYKPTQLQSRQYILGKQTGYVDTTGGNGLVTLNDSETLQFLCSTSYANLNTSTVFVVNQVSKIAITYDGTNTILYSNGKMIKSLNGWRDLNSNLTIGGCLHAGELWGTNWNYSNGYYKDIAIYNRSFTYDQLQNLYKD